MFCKTTVKSLALLAFVSVLTIFMYSLANADSMLETGAIINSKMKSLAAGTETEYRARTSDIKAIRIADSLPTDFVPSEANTVSTADSDNPIYIFFDNENDAGIIYFYTEGKSIKMNPDSGYMFANNAALADISGLADWDSSKVISLNGMFVNNSSLADISPLANWDTHNVAMLVLTFKNTSSLNDISALADWNTSNVTDMYGLFSGTSSLTDALALRYWDTSNVTDMSMMFSGATSLEIIDVSHWNTSKVTMMICMFQVGDNWTGNGQLREIVGLGNWDVSNVTDMTCMFYGAGEMTYYDVANWDVSKVESMNHMFCDNFNLRILDLSGWDVSSVKTMYCMFDDNKKLKSIGDVSHWNTASLIDVGGWLNDATSFIGDNYGKMDLSGWNTDNLKTAAEMFRATNLHEIDLSGWTFISITNDSWDGAGNGIYYETGNISAACKGLGEMFKDTPQLTKVWISQSGLDSYNAALENEVSTLDMWTGSKTSGFTVK